MNYQELQNAKESFPIYSLEKNYNRIYKERDKFTKHFSIKHIASMQIDDYVQGKQNKESFCYYLENRFESLGRITGSNAYKFGVFFSQEKKHYNFTKKFGATYTEAFSNVKKCILDLLDAGQKGDLRAMADNPISTMFKGKILSTYYPKQFLNIFSEKHLNYFLISLNLDTKELMKKDAVYKRQALLDFKNSDSDMKEWSVHMFGEFLYNYYPKAPLKPKERAVLKKDEDIIFPTIEDFSFKFIG